MKKKLTIIVLSISLILFLSYIHFSNENKKNIIINYIKNNEINKLYGQKFQNQDLLKIKLKDNMNLIDFVLNEYPTEKNLKFILEMTSEYNKFSEFKIILEQHQDLVNTIILLDNNTLLNYTIDSLDKNCINYNTKTNGRKLIEYLLEQGANPDQRGEFGKTSLHIAACKSNIQALKLFFKYGANPNIKDEMGNTPLHSAILNYADFDIVKTLVENNAKINILNSKKQTPLDIAYLNKTALEEELLELKKELPKVIHMKKKKKPLLAFGCKKTQLVDRKEFIIASSREANTRLERTNKIIQYLKAHGAKTGEEILKKKPSNKTKMDKKSNVL